ncbi:MAG: DNA topoisomerase (ATP-hydrolyzing) subunit B [Roseiflexaceae bacterium]
MATNTISTTNNDEYTASRIVVLEGLEAVRRRPGMYIGPTDINGLHHMIREVVDNSVDEALAGFASRVDITIHADGSVTVVDDGRGIPVDLHPTKKVSGLELAATQLHAGGKFDSNSYKVSSGLHGVGLSVVNALSTWMRIEVKKDGKLWMQEYNAGKPRGPVKPIGRAEGRGTIINFMPDVTIFKDGIDYNFKALAQRFREMAYLTKGLRFHVVDERDDNEVNFYFEGGIVSYVRHLNKDKNVLHKQPFYTEREIDGVAVEVALQYTEAYDTDSIYPFANNINNVDGGAHMTGFRTALTRVLNNYARGKNLLKENEANLTGDDVREGLTAVVSVKLQDPQFSSQTKEKLVSPEASSAVSSVFADAFAAWLDENPGESKRIIEKCVQAARTRLAVQKVRETARKSAMDGFSLPGKLADCSDTNPARCEIYIVEGDSAGGCLAPETPILLASGLVKTMQQLTKDWERGIQHLGYATDEAGDIRIVPLVEPRLTKRSAALVEVILDSGERIRCTPDHPFRLRDGSYRAAGELQTGEQLMSFIGDAAVALVPISASTATFDDLFTVNKDTGAGRGAPPWAPAAQSSLAMVAQAPHRLSTPTIGRIAGNHEGLPLRRDAGDAITVAAVRHLNERADVYDLTVDDDHNFALANGVFVHNSAKQGRDRRFQAILPLRGKILNVERSRLDKMLSNNEVRALITAIGASVGDQFDVAKLRYHRVLLMTDADVDGSHIRTLLLTFFFRYMRPLIIAGHLFIAQPPLFSVKQGKELRYVYNDAELESYLSKLPKEQRDKVYIQRYKGLGEMNAEQLWETTMNPANRIVGQVTLEDAQQADETFTMLMGDLVPPRKRFIQTHAAEVRNLDI